jgi:surface antigen
MVRSIERTAATGDGIGQGGSPRTHEPIVTATGSSLLLGAIAKSDAGRNLQHSDHLYLEAATLRALDFTPSGHPVHWCNPDTGNYGAVLSYVGEAPAGAQRCRDLEQTVTVGGRTGRGHGTAQRDCDGSWKLARHD